MATFAATLYSPAADSKPRFKMNADSMILIHQSLYTPPIIVRYAKRLNMKAAIANRLMVGSP